MTTSHSNTVRHAGEQRYRKLIEIPIFIVDVTAVAAAILEANRRAELVYGYTTAELAWNPASRLAPEESVASLRKIVDGVQWGETVTAGTTNGRRDGASFPVRAIAMLDPTGRRHRIAAVEDLTAEERRRSEADAIDAKRPRIAHEIHDGVAQSLGGLRFKPAQGLTWPVRFRLP